MVLNLFTQKFINAIENSKVIEKERDMKWE